MNKEWDLLQQYGNLVYGAGGSQSSTTQETNPSALQTAGSLGSAALGAYGMYKLLPLLAASDRRLKENITEVGVHEETGLTLYDFNYIAQPDQRWRGVMADEVIERFPEAVIDTPSGFQAVNYGMLGFTMEKVNV